MTLMLTIAYHTVVETQSHNTIYSCGLTLERIPLFQWRLQDIFFGGPTLYIQIFEWAKMSILAIV